MSSAKDLFESIKIGKENAVKVSNQDDRAFRTMVAEANKNGDCIINVGNGYYRPNQRILEEKYEAERYFMMEISRAREIEKKIRSMKRAFYTDYEQITFL